MARMNRPAVDKLDRMGAGGVSCFFRKICQKFYVSPENDRETPPTPGTGRLPNSHMETVGAVPLRGAGLEGPY